MTIRDIMWLTLVVALLLTHFFRYTGMKSDLNRARMWQTTYSNAFHRLKQKEDQAYEIEVGEVEVKIGDKSYRLQQENNGP